MQGKTYKTGIYWFTNDLRVHDNPLLNQAAESCDRLICIYFHKKHSVNVFNELSGLPLSQNRQNFTNQALAELDSNLKAVGQLLYIIEKPAIETLQALIEDYQVHAIYRSRPINDYDAQQWSKLRRILTTLKFHTYDNSTLYTIEQVGQCLSEFPSSYSKFRKIAQRKRVAHPVELVNRVPDIIPLDMETLEIEKSKPVNLTFMGGESHGLKQLTNYFSSRCASEYKDTRNAIDGWKNSCKFSPWLAQGCISARDIIKQLNQYERREGRNDSTYWIYFELLWREYFQWYSLFYGRKLFTFQGIASKAPKTVFNLDSFTQWFQGNTRWSIVNACMKELRQTGYISNRARQIVASCLVNELSCDWRYGAAYFEQQLIDYDVASNWGNWQYIAGVGADPRGGRHFNLEKQTEIFDPDEEYVERWN